jgi:Rrf2 family protein
MEPVGYARLRDAIVWDSLKKTCQKRIVNYYVFRTSKTRCNMAVNASTEYALRALIEIYSSKSGLISAQQLCDQQKLPKKFVEQLLTSLRNADILQSTPGARGGYSLARPADEITFLDVMLAVDDNSLDPSCTANKGEHCLGSDCRLTHFLDELSARQQKLFDSYTLKKIATTRKPRRSAQ